MWMSETVYISHFYQLKYDVPDSNLTKYEIYIRFYLIWFLIILICFVINS